MFARKDIKDALYYALPIFVWMGVIFYFSSLPGPAERHWSLKIFIERKGAHIVEFAILAWLVWRAIYHASEKNIQRSLLGAFLFSLLYAISDEVHQLFVFGREGRIQDVGFDVLGICGALLILWIVVRKKRKKYLPKKSARKKRLK